MALHKIPSWQPSSVSKDGWPGIIFWTIPAIGKHIEVDNSDRIDPFGFAGTDIITLSYNSGQGSQVLDPVFFIRTFIEDVYDRIYVTPKNTELGNITSDKTIAASIWNAYRYDAVNLASVDGQRVDGISLDLSVPLAMPSGFFQEFNILVSSEGPPTIDAIIEYNFGVNGIIDQYITGARIVILNFHPQDGLSENLNWKTDIKTSNDGSEERYQILDAPRTTQTMRQLIPSNMAQQLRNKMQNSQTKLWGVQTVQEGTILRPLNLPSGATEILFDTANAGYIPGGFAYLYIEEGVGVSFGVLEVLADRIVLDQPTSEDYIGIDGYICPMRLGYLRGSFDLKALDGIAKSFEIKTTFNINDDIDILDGQDFDYADQQYLGLEVFEGKFEFTTGAQEAALQKTYDVDFFAGKWFRGTDWTASKLKRGIKIIKYSREDIWNLRKFFYSIAGSMGEFWLPTYLEDFLPTSEIVGGSDSFTVKYQALEKVEASKLGHIRIVHPRDGIIFRKIISALPDLNFDDNIIQVDSDFSNDADQGSFTVSRLIKVRVESDSLKMRHFDSYSVFEFSTIEVS